MKIFFSENAKMRVKEIYSYYEIHASLKVANKLKASIFNKVKLLKTTPYAGSEEQSLKYLKRGYRKLVSGNYKIIYRVIENQIYVDTVFDARQSPEKLKKEMK